MEHRPTAPDPNAGEHQSPEKPDWPGLFATAASQAGYFTTTQARSHGYAHQLISHHVSGGQFERVRRGVYRLRDYPPSQWEEYMAAWLALGADAVISHETALEILGLSDVSGGTIHITLPRQQRGRRAPPGLTIHRPRSAELRSEDVLTREGMRITSPARSIVDAAAAGTDPEQVELAIHQAVKRGLVTPDQLLELASSRGRRVLEQVRQALEG